VHQKASVLPAKFHLGQHINFAAIARGRISKVLLGQKGNGIAIEVGCDIGQK
jgi:hypothetical protein